VVHIGPTTRKAISDVKAVIDGEKCQGHGRCALIVPTVFDVDDYGTGLVLVDEVSQEDEDEVREAVLCCPEQAITVLD
jgi:ferredoxin